MNLNKRQLYLKLPIILIVMVALLISNSIHIISEWTSMKSGNDEIIRISEIINEDKEIIEEIYDFERIQVFQKHILIDLVIFLLTILAVYFVLYNYEKIIERLYNRPLYSLDEMLDIRLNKELEQNNTRFQLLLKSMDVALWDMIIDVKNPIHGDNEFWHSEEFREMLGFKDKKEFPNTMSSWINRLHPDDHDIVLKALSDHIKDRTGKIPYDIEYRLKTKRGDWRYFHAFGSTLRDDDGIAIRIVGALADITDKKHIEEKLLNEYQKNEKLVHWYESILDATPIPITVTDLNMRWVLVNKAVEKFLKRDRNDLIGKQCSEWNSTICGTDQCGIHCARRGEVKTFFNNEGIFYKVNVSILKDKDEKEIGYIEVVQDITEERIH